MSLQDKVKKCIGIMDHVYGTFTKGPDAIWNPAPFSENKSRYLWTDAFGVCNYLTLYCETGEKQYLEQAEILVQNVHNILGKTRDGLQRLGDSTDERPLLCGLRIGKPKSEGPGMSDDGQYYHYLTKWMFALNRLSVVKKERIWNDWAIDLAKSAHSKFVRNDRMVWKMNVNLSAPLVNSEGGLDSYDGLTMYKVLQDTAEDKTCLKYEIDQMTALVNARFKRYHTNDCLDAGEALWLASWYPDERYAKTLYQVASDAVDRLWQHGEFKESKSYRLAFREFGTTIGVQMHEALTSLWQERVQYLNDFWEKDLYHRDKDITPIMFCTSLVPGVMHPDYKFN